MKQFKKQVIRLQDESRRQKKEVSFAKISSAVWHTLKHWVCAQLLSITQIVDLTREIIQVQNSSAVRERQFKVNVNIMYMDATNNPSSSGPASSQYIMNN